MRTIKLKTIKLLLSRIIQPVFWSWNLIFISVVYFGLLPYIGIPLIEATLDGDIAFDFCLAFITLITVPVACSYIGARYLRTQPQKLMRWFYGVEAPIFVWCLVRLFLIRELTLASTLVLGTLLLCIFAYGAEVLDVFKDYQHHKLFSGLQIIVHALILLMGLYGGLVLLFYVVPAACSLIVGIIAVTIVGIKSFILWFFAFKWIAEFWHNLIHGRFIFWTLWGFLATVFFGFTSTLFLGMPFAIIALYVNSGRRVFQAFAQQYSQKLATIAVVAVISSWLIVLHSFNQQPQVQAFKLLDQAPQDRQALLASSDVLRRGLVNANLYPYRYVSSAEDNNHIFSMYDKLGLPQAFSRFVQNRYNQLLSPFLYQGDRDDVQESADLYAEFFDAPLQKAERKSVRHALQSTSIVDEAKAGLLNIDQKKVWLEKQEVNLEAHGDWAEIEIHEVYQNQTNDVEEILYYFSLPESAAIMGLWLGETEKLNERFAFQVAPRGAAQEVYNSQVERSRPIDPALLEQVGPGQYRLRAFPVPGRLPTKDILDGDRQPKMHLWLTYKVMKQDQGWALPKLAEKRNIFWTRNTKRIRDGKTNWFLTNWFFGDAWLEDFIGEDANQTKNNPVESQVKSPGKSPGDRQSHQINLTDGYAVAVEPLNNQDYSLPSNKKYALILDTSYSMTNHAAEVRETFDWWSKNLANNRTDLYITDVSANQAKYLINIRGFDPTAIKYFGSMQTPDMLQQFQQLQQLQSPPNSKNYDAVLLITDQGSYELSKDNQEFPTINSPLWMIHLGDELPKVYDDAVLQAIQHSNGGVANNIPTVMKRLATETANSLVVDGYSWTVSKASTENTLNNNTKNSIEPLAARQLVSSLSQKSKSQLSLPEIDAVHQVAQEYDIVTPYSSMIVLVNDAQKELLKQAESKSDRFEREVETGVEQLSQPSNPFQVSGVPEPGVWILLGIVAIALLLVSQKEKVAKILD